MTETLLHLPPEVRGPSAWYGPDLTRHSDWLESLSQTEVAEVEDATQRLVLGSKDIVAIRVEDFPLPTLGLRLRGLLDEVLGGRGFVLLRALPIERWTKHEAAVAFLGIGAHLGNLRSQNAQGHVLGHIKNLGYSSS